MLIEILWLILMIKSLFFWVWLWQLKEYHWGRFKAYFETLGLGKFIFSYYRIKIPKLTDKVIVILFIGIVLELVFVRFFNSYVYLVVSFIIAPLIFSIIILVFQIPVVMLRKRTLKKAEQKRKQFKELLVIGITGSYGKTSTKEFLYAVLSKKFNVLKTKKHINAEIGIAKAILNDLKKEHQIFIVEMGAYERGKIKEVCEMVKPSMGIITGINEQHMSTFGSLDNIKDGKYELIESLPEQGLAVFNGYNEHCREMYERTSIHKRITEKIDVETKGEHISFSINNINFKINLLGKHNAENILLAVFVARELGISLEETSKIFEKLEPLSGALKRKKKVLDATYSANLHGVLSHLDYLSIYPGRKALVMPCLIELGSASKEIHKKIGEKIDRVCDLGIITTKDRFKELRGSSDKIIYMNDSKKIFDKVKGFDIILLESRVPEKLKQWLLKK